MGAGYRRRHVPSRSLVSCGGVGHVESMRVVILGGTGRLGGAVARAVLQRGHVAVCVGRSATRDAVPEGAEPCAGDVMDAAFLAAAVADADAVVAALSIPRTSRSPFAPVVGPHDLHSQSTRALLAAMPTGRLLKVSAQSVGDSAPRAGWGFRALVAMSNLRPAFADHAVADELVMASELDWTIVRPPILAPGRRGPLVATEDATTWSWTRVGIEDLGEWIAVALESTDTARRVLSIRPA
jgi:uncharacterized protein YbjT (DUF2867 family)